MIFESVDYDFAKDKVILDATARAEAPRNGGSKPFPIVGTSTRPLSYSAVNTFLEDEDAFYQRYGLGAWGTQTMPMVVGSAFDCYVKAALMARLLGVNEVQVRNDFLERAIDNKDLMLEACNLGASVFDFYKGCSAYDYILGLIGGAVSLGFEEKVLGIVPGVTHSDGSPVLGVGKPDVWWRGLDGVLRILDWKVNGYYAKSGHSPVPGYSGILPGGKAHATWDPIYHCGELLNSGFGNCLVGDGWSRQLLFYHQLMGGHDGGVCYVDQIVCRPSGMRVAQHRCLVGGLLLNATWLEEIKACIAWRPDATRIQVAL